MASTTYQRRRLALALLGWERFLHHAPGGRGRRQPFTGPGGEDVFFDWGLSGPALAYLLLTRGGVVRELAISGGPAQLSAAVARQLDQLAAAIGPAVIRLLQADRRSPALRPWQLLALRRGMRLHGYYQSLPWPGLGRIYHGGEHGLVPAVVTLRGGFHLVTPTAAPGISFVRDDGLRAVLIRDGQARP